MKRAVSYYIGTFDGRMSSNEMDRKKVVDIAVNYAKQKGLTCIYMVRESEKINSPDKIVIAVRGAK